MNLMQNIDFSVMIARAPNLTIRANKASLPGITANGPMQQTPFKPAPLVPDALEFGGLSLTCLMDENMTVFEQMFEWIMMGTPSSFEQFDASKHEGTHYSDITVQILNSKKNPIVNMIYEDALPVSMSNVDLDTTQTQRSPVDFTVDFAFKSFKIERIK